MVRATLLDRRSRGIVLRGACRRVTRAVAMTPTCAIRRPFAVLLPQRRQSLREARSRHGVLRLDKAALLCARSKKTTGVGSLADIATELIDCR